MADVGQTPLRLTANPDLATNSDYPAKPRAPILLLNQGIPRFNSETRHPTGRADAAGNQESLPIALFVLLSTRGGHTD